MPSPFPGMDPYIEFCGRWRDFHQHFITHWADALNEQLPDNYVAQVDERASLVEVPGGRPRDRLPDVAVIQTYPLPSAIPASAPALTIEPVQGPLQLLDEVEDAYIELYHYPDMTLIAILELLSPSNKEPHTDSEYLLKWNALLRQEVHLIEVDLLLQGHRLPMAGPLPQGDYYVFVSRAGARKHSDVYGWELHQPLPVISLPLREPDADLRFNLQAVFQTTFDRCRYQQLLRYQDPPTSALPEGKMLWIGEVLRRFRPQGGLAGRD